MIYNEYNNVKENWYGGKILPEESRKLALRIANVLESKKAIDVMVLDISHLTTIADCFVLASGNSERQVKSLCDELEEAMEQQGIKAHRREGYRFGRWIVLDYNDVVVHILHRDERAFYNLEKLWADSLPLSVRS
jgi:ribosome-associated protein